MTEWVESLLDDMTLPEKIGQMTQVSCFSISPAEVAEFAIGSVLSGGDDNPEPNNPANWLDLAGGFVSASRQSRLGVPVIYGVDAVHGHSNVRGATIFPHNIGLGAIADAGLVRRIGQVTATEMAATGVRWTFAPTVAVPQDIRWGRTFEGYSRETRVVSALGAAVVDGLQHNEEAPVLACAKHFVGDGGTEWGSVTRDEWVGWWDDWEENWQIDQGDLRVTEEELRATHLPPYRSAVDAGAMSVMASYSSWNGVKMHGHRSLLSDVLKKEFGFAGFVVSDWMGVDQLDSDYDVSVVKAINAGVDMVMVPHDFKKFIDAVKRAVADGAIGLDRIDDAVRRILTAKASIGLHRADQALPALDVVGDASHRALAAEAARRSAVLLEDSGVLPIPSGATVEVAGVAADDIGLQCGGWSVGWLGSAGRDRTDGATLLDGLRELHGGEVRYDPQGRFDDSAPADVAVVCLGERPYAEGVGDNAEPALTGEQVAVVERMRKRCRKLILVLYSGRPLIATASMELADATVAAWLPGSEADDIAGLLVGRHQFEGKLPQPWPRTAADLGDKSLPPLFPVGHRATTR